MLVVAFPARDVVGSSDVSIEAIVLSRGLWCPFFFKLNDVFEQLFSPTIVLCTGFGEIGFGTKGLGMEADGGTNCSKMFCTFPPGAESEFFDCFGGNGGGISFDLTSPFEVDAACLFTDLEVEGKLIFDSFKLDDCGEMRSSLVSLYTNGS